MHADFSVWTEAATTELLRLEETSEIISNHSPRALAYSHC